MTATMPARDVFQRVNDLDAATVQRLVDRMEARRRDPTFSAWRDAYLDRLDLGHAATALEVGCGSGVVARAIAARDDYAGPVVAVDYSQALVAAGRHLAAVEGVGARIEFAVQDSHALSLPDGSIDVVIAHTLLSHLTHPLRGLAEMARVARPGALVAVFDGDYASLTFATRDPDAAATMDRALVEAMAGNPTVLRTLPRAAAAVGLEVVDVTAHVLAEVGVGRFFVSFAETYAPMAAEAGLAPEPLVSSWLDEQQRANSTGTFFAACNYYSYLLRRTDTTPSPAGNQTAEVTAPEYPSGSGLGSRRPWRSSHRSAQAMIDSISTGQGIAGGS